MDAVTLTVFDCTKDAVSLRAVCLSNYEACLDVSSNMLRERERGRVLYLVSRQCTACIEHYKNDRIKRLYHEHCRCSSTLSADRRALYLPSDALALDPCDGFTQ